MPALGLFAAFEAVDVAVFVTHFTWFGIGGSDWWVFKTAVVLPDLVPVVIHVGLSTGTQGPGLARR